MTITVIPRTTESMTLAEYIAYVSANVDLTDRACILESAEQLAALANNRSFLVEYLNDELRELAVFQTDNQYSSQTITLGGGAGFAVRANMWVPPGNTRAGDDWESDLFAYERPHDHNFSFLTVGYFGSGYRTSIYEYEHEAIVGYPGERVELQFLEKTELTRGKVMFYRASKDIHSQEHPDDFSVSLNLMISTPEVTSNSQFWFDLERGTIRDFVQQNPSSGRMMMCHLARYFGDPETASLLEQITEQHAFARVRLSAYESLASIETSSAGAVWSRAAGDRHPLVRHTARRVLESGSDTVNTAALTRKSASP